MMTASPPDLLALAAAVTDLERAVLERPLAFWRAWDRPAPRTSQRRALSLVATHRTVIVLGGNRCLAPETMIGLADGTRRRIDSIREPVDVLTPFGVRRAYPAPRKGPDPLYRVETTTGESFTATAAHHVLGASGWLPVSQLRPGSALVRLPSSSGTCQPTPPGDAPRSTRTPPGSRSGCRRSRHSDGEPPPPDRGSALGSPPSPADAPARSLLRASGPGDARADGPPPTPGCSPAGPPVGPRASSGDPAPTSAPAADTGSCASRTTSRSSATHSRDEPQPPRGSNLQPRSSPEAPRSAIPGPHLYAASGTSVVSSITLDRIDYHHDLTVPDGACFAVDGLVHHNTGKTELLLAVLVALILGSDHPDARDFWLGNGMQPDQFPRGPARGWIVALTSAASLEYHRDRVVALLPKVGPVHPSSKRGACWAAWNLDGRDEARLEIAVPGYDPEHPQNLAGIVFKSDTPGKNAFQGSKLRACLHDEESILHGSETWSEAHTRLADLAGWHMMANTFLQGKTWVHRRWVQERKPEDGVALIYATDNPYLPASAIADLSEDPKMIRAKLYGDAVVLTGQVYPFDRAVHIIPTVPIPPEWPRFRTIDFGTRHPFACVWLAVARRRLDLPDGRHIPDGAIVAYREHYKAEETTRYHVTHIREAEGSVWREADPQTGRKAGWDHAAAERIAMTWVDPEDAQQMLQLVIEHGIEAIPANKSKRMGVDRVCADMAPHKVDQLPRLYFMDSCPNTIREHENLVRPPESERRNASETPITKDDHTTDCVRYGVVGIREWYGGK